MQLALHRATTLIVGRMPLPAPDARAVHSVFQKLEELLPPNPDFKGRGLKTGGPRQQQRWFLHGDLPSPSNARAIGAEIWTLICEASAADRGKYFDLFREWAPPSSIEQWNVSAEEGHQALNRSRQLGIVSQTAKIIPFVQWFFSFIDTARATKPLAITLTVLVDGRPLAMGPVRAGQRVRLEVASTREAFHHVLWITPIGNIQPLFPWEPKLERGAVRFVLRPDLYTPSKHRTLPSPGPSQDWAFEDTKGLETVVAFATEEPLSEEELHLFIKEFKPLRTKPTSLDLPEGPVTRDMHSAAASAIRLELFPPPRDQAVEDRHNVIAARLASYLDAGRCITFRNDGPPKPLE